ncbi:MAG: hypothetical protein JSV20_06655 [Candidatus Bathyarchaeota archaeon]|nr:MAG: hypothetical protein JSV20_06655 [Candidatus Bathyarchaeota archaeon]
MERTHRRYPTRFQNPDLNRKIKIDTLEALCGQWRSVKELFERTTLRIGLGRSQWRCLSIRLLRYYRAGLLYRRRVGRRYEYTLTEKGENRLFYLWINCGLLSGQSEPHLAALRRKMFFARRFERLQKKWMGP